MPYSLPAAADFKARYVEFDPVSDVRVELFIAESLGSVSETWFENDYRPALLAHVAHMLAVEGEPGLSAGIGSSAAEQAFEGQIVSEKVGDVETRFGSSSGGSGGGSLGGGAVAGDYNSSAYGVRYLMYMRRNVTPVATV